MRSCGKGDDVTNYIVYAIAMTAVVTLLALALSVYLDGIGYTVLHLVALAGVGAYTFAILARRANPPGLAAIIAIGVAAGAGLLTAAAIRSLRGDGLTLASFGVGVAMFEIFRYLRVTEGVFGIGGIPELQRSSTPLLRLGTSVAILTAAILVFSTWRRSVAGAVAVAIRLDEPAAVSIGTPLRSHQLLSGVLAGALAGVAGVLLAATTQFIEPRDFRVSVNLLPITAVIIARGRTPLRVAVTAAVISAVMHLARFVDRSATLAGPIVEISIAVALAAVLVVSRVFTEVRRDARR